MWMSVLRSGGPSAKKNISDTVLDPSLILHKVLASLIRQFPSSQKLINIKKEKWIRKN